MNYLKSADMAATIISLIWNIVTHLIVGKVSSKKSIAIINKNLKRIEQDLKEIEGLKNIDFIDIFPISKEHRQLLDKEAIEIATLIKETERGNIYLLDEPVKTKYGNLRLIKIRFFDETRLNWEAAADFVVKDRNVLKQKVDYDNRFKYIVRPDWDAIEFKTNDTLVYFLEPLASEVYLNEK